ncbi:hypothetical protein MTR_6g464680 [Medicago truncatula]|uniref:Uncharacterized protein n=1 Tax=Medicago truncatula TaxID=3880 RepID=A0A072UAV6_MEDTR|nr:hypothetical protein MTR_6g464680 [Medicago truncatula]
MARHSPSKKEADMYEVSNYDHLAAKLGSATNGVEKMNYAQYNQGMRQNQNFYKNPQNSYGQVAPPGYGNNQRIAQKSSSEILMENYVMNQSKQLQELKNEIGFLNDSLSKLTTKVESIATHTKVFETQISQVAQQVATFSQTLGVFPGQTKTNPKAHVNAISFGGSKLEETIAKTKDVKGESVKLLGESDVIESEKPLDKTKAPSPLRLSKLNLEAQFNKFVNILKKIYIKIPFAKASSRMPLYAKFLKENFSKKKTIEHNETIALTRETQSLRSHLQSLVFPSLDIPVKIEGIYIPADFLVVDTEEDHHCPMILGRTFLATAGAIVDVKNGRIVFQVSDEMIGFELENVMKGPAFYSCCMIKDHDVKERFLASATQYDLFDPF